MTFCDSGVCTCRKSDLIVASNMIDFSSKETNAILFGVSSVGKDWEAIMKAFPDAFCKGRKPADLAWKFAELKERQPSAPFVHPDNFSTLNSSTASVLVQANAAVADHACKAAVDFAHTPASTLECASLAASAATKAELATLAAKNAVATAIMSSSSKASIAEDVLGAVASAKEASEAAELATGIAKVLTSSIPAAGTKSKEEGKEKVEEEKEQQEQLQQQIETEQPVDEVWDIVKAYRPSPEKRCDTPDCKNQACSLWACGNEKWNCCLNCQLEDFGGWPFGFEVPDFLQPSKKKEQKRPVPNHEIFKDPYKSGSPPEAVFSKGAFMDTDSDSDDAGIKVRDQLSKLGGAGGSSFSIKLTSSFAHSRILLSPTIFSMHSSRCLPIFQ